MADYQQSWDLQGQLLREAIAQKQRINQEPDKELPRLHHLLFCEHMPVYTLGKSGSMDNLLLSEAELAEKEIAFYPINRGGDITFHGPGQVVGYPIFDLEGFYRDVHRYVRMIEEIVIQMLKEYGLEGTRIDGYTGVWLKNPNRKICAIGVHMSRWVSMHGFALNVNTDMSYFNYIIPCGISDSDKSLTSMEVELNRTLDLQEVKSHLKYYFKELFGFEYLGL